MDNNIPEVDYHRVSKKLATDLAESLLKNATLETLAQQILEKLQEAETSLTQLKASGPTENTENQSA